MVLFAHPLFSPFDGEVVVAGIGVKIRTFLCGNVSIGGAFDGTMPARRGLILTPMVVAGVSLHPSLVIVGAAAEDLFVKHRDGENLTEEEDHLLGAGETAEVAVDDDAVEAVVYVNEQAVKQFCE